MCACVCFIYTTVYVPTVFCIRYTVCEETYLSDEKCVSGAYKIISHTLKRIHHIAGFAQFFPPLNNQFI